MSDFKVSYKTRNVNSKRMLKEFKAVIEEVCDEFISHRTSLLDKTYEYDELVGFLHMYLDDLVEKKTITQYDVVADTRNNDALSVRDGKIHVLVCYRQTHCLNVTEIEMIFKA